MLENFFLIFLYHAVVDIFNVCNNHDNNVKINHNFIDVTHLIQFHLQILNFEKIHRINNDRKHVCESNTDVFHFLKKDLADFCIILFTEYETGLGIHIDQEKPSIIQTFPLHVTCTATKWEYSNVKVVFWGETDSYWRDVNIQNGTTLLSHK